MSDCDFPTHEDITRAIQRMKREGWIIDKIIKEKKRPWRIA